MEPSMLAGVYETKFYEEFSIMKDRKVLLELEQSRVNKGIDDFLALLNGAERMGRFHAASRVLAERGISVDDAGEAVRKQQYSKQMK